MRRLISLVTVFLACSALAQRSDTWTYNPNPVWNESWNQRPNPTRGACFYTTSPYRGNRFCVLRGDKLSKLPEDFGDNISSVQTFGGARVRIFDDHEFTGESVTLARSVPDLRGLRFRGGHTWNNRISSIMVF